ncbi:MAG: WYL domain-containing protein [Bacteroidota bacterium]
MATNKHATIRYQTLNKCFRNAGRKYFIDDLIEACNFAIEDYSGKEGGIKKRQIFEDIKYMESEQGWNIPLEHLRDGHKVYYKYADSNFSINNQPLNASEENKLKEAIITLSRFKGLPQFEWVDEITARLDSGLKLTADNKIIDFEQNKYLKGVEFFTPIYDAILNKKVIEIEYKSFKISENQKFILHPYFLKQYNNRWYIFALNDTSNQIINLSLDRIIEINELNIQYLINKSIDFNEYFEDLVGVTLSKEGVVQNIILKVSNLLFPYIQTKPIHGSQKVKEQGVSHSFISLDLIPNYELESLILSYGEGVEILHPSSLRNKIKKRVELININYKN